jgi:dipeptidase
MIDDTSFITKIIDYAWVVVSALVGLVYKLTDNRMTKMETDWKERAKEIEKETDRNRDVSAKIFDKLSEMQKDSAERHERIITALHIGLAGKADK